MTSSHEPVVKTRELTKSYGEFTALDRLSIEVNKGEILGFIGPNGAGKTTTIKILVGLSKPTSGTATIAGIDCTKQSKQIKQAVGYMPDKFGVYDNMRVREYLDFFAAIYGIGPKQRKTRIGEVMDTTNCTYMQDKFVESLSHGMQQRVGIARIMLHDPDVLILDEPANGLDPKARIEMREILLNLASMGKTLIVTSHILPELSRICNVVAIITGGVLRAFGPLSSVMKDLCPRQTFEVQLLDASRTDQVVDLVSRQSADGDLVTGSAAESVVRIQTSRSESELSQLLGMLIREGIDVAQFREVPSDLEDAFINVTKDESGGPLQPKFASDEIADDSEPVAEADIEPTDASVSVAPGADLTGAIGGALGAATATGGAAVAATSDAVGDAIDEVKDAASNKVAEVADAVGLDGSDDDIFLEALDEPDSDSEVQA